MGFKKAMESAQPVLLEPIMNVEVTAPGRHGGHSDWRFKQPARSNPGNGCQRASSNRESRGPVWAEILKYAPILTSITAGKGSYAMEFSGYEQAPREVVNKVVEEHKAAKEAV